MDFSLVGLWLQMGPFAKTVVAALTLMSLASLLVFVERLTVFFTHKHHSSLFLSALEKNLETGNLSLAAQAHYGKNLGYAGRVLSLGLKAFRENAHHPETTMESVARSLERQGAREIQQMKRGLGLLATVASTAPFVGLLGTVMGIVTAFESMAKEGSGGLGAVSAGIAEALVTTALGLLVAIPAVMAYNCLQTWVDARAVDIAESSNEFLEVLCQNIQKEGHPHAPFQPEKLREK
ncbi:MAG: MotA/TolQ/ExbB proton channel family protein [Proteobacteria bacterium]|nr:MotA/TolQ/ExbB proton channel family protein [Cystobacterineae bacterium]MCL2258489.1 MotA/TolQ/ExbB proton channel family protein [Cystobacterineae bacterium]MCL2315171.1 MotA/TolQ/ExbB proton channel family protein [Pseudomonadota bacterium]